MSYKDALNLSLTRENKNPICHVMHVRSRISKTYAAPSGLAVSPYNLIATKLNYKPKQHQNSSCKTTGNTLGGLSEDNHWLKYKYIAASVPHFIPEGHSRYLSYPSSTT